MQLLAIDSDTPRVLHSVFDSVVVVANSWWSHDTSSLEINHVIVRFRHPNSHFHLYAQGLEGRTVIRASLSEPHIDG